VLGSSHMGAWNGPEPMFDPGPLTAKLTATH
jgi:hypothetical protein